MNLSIKIERFYKEAKQNRWYRYFTVFNRVALAAGFFFAGYVKIMGERFTDLHSNHPMGHYLDAIYDTGYYYTFVGILQVAAAIMLLIPRTATLGAVIYFPIILNIAILSHSVCFIGSLHSSPLMVLSNIYLLCWDYDKLKYMLPFYGSPKPAVKEKLSNRFPIVFFGLSFAAVVVLLVIITNAYDIQPYNTCESCMTQCEDSTNPEACKDFCDCIHSGGAYHKCLEEYENAIESD